jgi:hypothetical protein
VSLAPLDQCSTHLLQVRPCFSGSSWASLFAHSYLTVLLCVYVAKVFPTPAAAAAAASFYLHSTRFGHERVHMG